MINSGYQQTLEWYNKNASIYAKRIKEHSSIDQKQLTAFTSWLEPGSRILDAGCGSGRDSILFQSLGFDVIGVDISEQLLAEAHNAYPAISFQKGDLLSLPFQDNFFEGVWAHASVVHFDKVEQVKTALNEFYRVLKKGGILHLLVRAQRKSKGNGYESDSISNDNRYYFNFTQQMVKDYLTELHFELLTLIQYDESKLDPHKRPGEGIEWILALAQRH